MIDGLGEGELYCDEQSLETIDIAKSNDVSPMKIVLQPSTEPFEVEANDHGLVNIQSNH